MNTTDAPVSPEDGFDAPDFEERFFPLLVALYDLSNAGRSAVHPDDVAAISKAESADGRLRWMMQLGLVAFAYHYVAITPSGLLLARAIKGLSNFPPPPSDEQVATNPTTIGDANGSESDKAGAAA